MHRVMSSVQRLVAEDIVEVRGQREVSIEVPVDPVGAGDIVGDSMIGDHLPVSTEGDSAADGEEVEDIEVVIAVVVMEVLDIVVDLVGMVKVLLLLLLVLR